MEAKLTKRFCENVSAGSERLTIRDTEVRGLRLRVSPSGVKAFSVEKKVAGRACRVTLGRFPAVSVEQARKRAMAAIGEAAEGGSLKRRRPTDPTLGEVLTHAVAVHWSKTRRKGVEQQRLIEAYSPRWKPRRLSEISRGDIQAAHTRIGRERGEYAANRWHEVIRRLFNIADRDFGFLGKNPATGIERFTEQSRERFLDASEVRRFLDAVEASPHEDARDFLTLLLFTGARKGSLYRMRWADISGDVWTIPAEDSKNGRPVSLPLAAAAIETLRRRADNGSEYVFPGRHGRGHLTDIRKPVRAVWKAAGIQGVRLHDLRRTLGSWLAAGGASELVVAKSLGHQDTTATRVYARLNLAPVRQAVEQAVGAMRSR